MNQLGRRFNIVVVASPIFNVCGEVNVMNILQTLEPISDNIFVITSGLRECQNRKIKVRWLKGWQPAKRSLLLKILNHILVDLQISLHLLMIAKRVEIVAFHIGARAVSYTHLTLPTN